MGLMGPGHYEKKTHNRKSLRCVTSMRCNDRSLLVIKHWYFEAAAVFAQTLPYVSCSDNYLEKIGTSNSNFH